MLEICRICGETTQGTNAKNLFECDQNLFIHQVELLTGEWLEFSEELPAQICICCEQDFYVAASFRVRCIRTQKKLRQHKNLAVQKPNNIDPINTKEELLVESDGPIDIKGELLDESDNEDEIYEEIENDSIKEIFVEENDDGITYDNVDDDVDNKLKPLIKIEQVVVKKNTDKKLRTPLVKFTSQKSTLKKGTNLSNTNIKTEKPTRNIVIPKQRKYINWRTLSEDQAREMKRLLRQRDCVCDQCGKHFNDQSNLKLHLLRHTGIKNYECNECGAKFYTAHLLKRHCLLHKGVPLYHCDYCEKSFNYSKSKIEHERIHRNEKPYKCGTCDKYFRTTGKLREHQVVHTGVRRFHCDVCDKWFLARKNLVAHFKSKFHKEQVQNQIV